MFVIIVVLLVMVKKAFVVLEKMKAEDYIPWFTAKPLLKMLTQLRKNLFFILYPVPEVYQSPQLAAIFPAPTVRMQTFLR